MPRTRKPPQFMRLATVDGCEVARSRDLLATLDRHIVKSKLARRQDFDLPGPGFRDFLVPHAHGLATDAERISYRLMRAAKVIEDFLERAHKGPSDSECAVSVSVLPSSVKRLTRGPSMPGGKLPYVSNRRTPKDAWAIRRGEDMKAAREAMGLSQARVAEYAGIGHRETISQYESGIIEDIDPSVIPALARTLGLPPQRLSRTPWDYRDEAADLKVSTVARQIAYSFDGLPLVVQNQIRATIKRYEDLVREHGQAAADALLTPPASDNAESKPISKKRRETGQISFRQRGE